jgi:hypothetical protein
MNIDAIRPNHSWTSVRKDRLLGVVPQNRFPGISTSRQQDAENSVRNEDSHPGYALKAS